MGPADQGTRDVEEAGAGLQQGAGAIGVARSGAAADLFGLRRRKPGHRSRQGRPFYGEKGEVAAAVVASPAAGDGGAELLSDPPAKLIDLLCK